MIDDQILKHWVAFSHNADGGREKLGYCLGVNGAEALAVARQEFEGENIAVIQKHMEPLIEWANEFDAG